MTRHVFPTSEIPHLWVHAEQRDARNPGGNLYFRDDTIYSYRDSWPLARIFRRKVKGALFTKDNPACNLVLANSARYSVTTAKHQGMAERAVSHLPCVSVPHCTLDAWGNPAKERHAQNLAYLAKVADSALEKAQRAMQARTVDWRRATAQRAVDDARAYMDFFSIKRKRPAMPEVAWASAFDRARRIESPDPVRDAAKFKARERRQAATAQKFGQRRQAWRDNSGESDYYRLTRAERRQWRGLPVMLRVNGEEIETSLGARIPLVAAPMVWAAVQRVRQRGKAWEPSGLGGMKIGHYAVSSIAADGTLTAGCHVIPFAELALMATRLGL